MSTLVWSKAFVRAYKRLSRQNPHLRHRVEHSLQQLVDDPFYPALHSHKLKGSLTGSWACTVAYDYRIVFEFVENPDSGEEEILAFNDGDTR